MTAKECSEFDFKYLHLSKCDKSLVYDFLSLINKETLAGKVSRSLGLRKQGHFDKAMLNISEVNRDQVLAIREAQEILDKLKSQEKTEIVFEKYRQTFPFQIGITNGDEILNIINQIKLLFDGGFSSIVSKLHDNEVKVGLLNDELDFFEKRMKGLAAEEESDTLRNNILILVEEMQLAKKLIIDNIVNGISEQKFLTNSNDMLGLVKCIYLIMTSSVETLDANLVDV